MLYIGRLSSKVVKAMYHPEMPKKIILFFALPQAHQKLKVIVLFLYQGVIDAVTAIVNAQLWVWHICWMISRTPVQQQEKCVQRGRWVKQAACARAMHSFFCFGGNEHSNGAAGSEQSSLNLHSLRRHPTSATQMKVNP